MTLFDYIVLTILIASVIISVLRGLVKEILSLASWLVAFMVANTFAVRFAAMLPAWMATVLPGDMARLVAAFGLLFLGALLLGALVNLATGQIIKASGLVLADRGLGGLFGFARGALIVLTLVMLAGLTALPQQPFWRDALLSPLAETAVRTVKPMLPSDWARHVHF